MCPSEESCRLVENINKPKEDPKMDFILKIRSISMFQPLINKFIQQQAPQTQEQQKPQPIQQLNQPIPQEQHQQMPQQQPVPIMNQKVEQQQLQSQEPNNQLNGCLLDKISSPENKCPTNQVCLIKNKQPVCVCPEELNLRLIDGVCREIYDSMVGCTMYLNECTTELNEECVSLNSYSKHGTCQCKLGFRRNPTTFSCESEKKVLENNNFVKKLNNRRRPPLTFEDNTNTNTNNDVGSLNNVLNDKNFEPLIQEIYDELSQEANLKSENKPNKMEEPASTTKFIEPATTTHPELITSITSTKKTVSPSISTTTPLPTTTRTYEPPSLYTETLKANAGKDIHVYYPSTMCILNGTLTSFFTKNPYEYYITKWEWIKLDTSPAFGVYFFFIFPLFLLNQ